MNFQIENVSCNSEEDLHSFVQLDFITCRAHKANSLVPCIRKVAKSCQALLKLFKLTKAQFVKKKQISKNVDYYRTVSIERSDTLSFFLITHNHNVTVNTM